MLVTPQDLEKSFASDFPSVKASSNHVEIDVMHGNENMRAEVTHALENIEVNLMHAKKIAGDHKSRWN